VGDLVDVVIDPGSSDASSEAVHPGDFRDRVRRPHPGVADTAGMTAKWHRIVIRDRLSEPFATAFDGRSVEGGRQRHRARGGLADVTRLYGLLDSLRELELELVGVSDVRS
jgi:hypothetical protein